MSRFDQPFIHAEDFPKSGKEGKPGSPIHHEPGLWLHMRDERTNGIDIARLSTVPHGDSVLALGRNKGPDDGLPEIPSVEGLFIGDTRDPKDPYPAPYVHFQDCHFHGFDPFNPHLQLEFLNKKLAYDGIKILRTTTLEVDTIFGASCSIPPQRLYFFADYFHSGRGVFRTERAGRI